MEDFAAVIKILCREVKQKCTERVTGWGDGQSSHIIEQSKCLKAARTALDSVTAWDARECSEGTGSQEHCKQLPHQRYSAG